MNVEAHSLQLLFVFKQEGKMKLILLTIVLSSVLIQDALSFGLVGGTTKAIPATAEVRELAYKVWNIVCLFFVVIYFQVGLPTRNVHPFEIKTRITRLDCLQRLAYQALFSYMSHLTYCSPMFLNRG